MSEISVKETFRDIANTFDEVDRRVLLWTNPDQTGAMGATTITLSDNLSNYDAYEVDFNGWLALHRMTQRCGNVTQEIMLSFADSSVCYRTMTPATDTTMTVVNGKSGGNDTSSACIPRKVYGIQYGASAGDGSSGGTMNYPDLLHKPTINGVTLVEGLVTEDLDLGDTAHEEVTQAEFDALTPEQRDDGTVYFIRDGIVGNVFLDDNTPIGTIAPFGGTSDPSYWLICDGRAISRTDYAALFGVIGTTYGAGDGSTTFNIPDFTGNVAVGASATLDLGDTGGEATHTLTVNEMPSHAHTLLYDGSGSFSFGYQYSSRGARSAATEASSGIGNTGGGQAHNNMQPYVVTNYIIKYASTVSEHQANIDFYYPVGSYYETSDSTFDPNVTWGGTWTSETITDDCIVEQGTVDIWTYRKWASGISECWGHKTNSYSSWVAWGNIYETNTNLSAAYPTGLFVSDPQVSVKATCSGGYCFAEYNNGSSTTTPVVYALRATTGSASGTYGADFIAKGLWKTYVAPNTQYRWHRTA